MGYYETYDPSDRPYDRTTVPDADITAEIDYGNVDGVTATEGGDDIPDDPPNSQDRITDSELNDMLVDSIKLLGGTDRLDPFLRAAEHLNRSEPASSEPGAAVDPNAGYKELLQALPEYELAVASGDITRAQADSLLEHALYEGAHPSVDPPKQVVKSVIGVVSVASEPGWPIPDREIAAAHNALWVAGEVEALRPALSVLEHGRRAGLSLRESGELVEQAAVVEDMRFANHDVQQLAHTLSRVERGTDPSLTRQVFGSFQGVNPRYREQVYSSLRAVLDNARANGVPHSDIFGLITREMAAVPDSGLDTTVFDIQTFGYMAVRLREGFRELRQARH